MESTESAGYQVRIVPALRQIQDKFGFLNPEALRGFSKDSGIPLYRLQAVASFFPHFRLTPPPAVTVSVCRDMACHLNGSAEMIAHLEKTVGDRVCVEGVSCVGRCDRPPGACVTIHKSEKEHSYLGRSAAEMEAIVSACLEGSAPKPDHDRDLRMPVDDWKINPYSGKPEYRAARKAAGKRKDALQAAADHLMQKTKWTAARAEEFRSRAKTGRNTDYRLDQEMYDAVVAWQTDSDWAKAPEMGGWADVLLAEFEDKEGKNADLRGLGGAGIPASQKWNDVREAVRTARRRRADDRAYIVVNGDESEPGTFKDRELLLRTPHLIVEGVILAGLITEATEGFIYIRHEFHEQIEACRAEIKRAEAAGFCGPNAEQLGRPFPVSVFVSPGGYICGEQSALIEAMSDRRGEPRNLPPKLETNGLDDQPTLVSNVETYAWTPFIQLNGGPAYAKMGVNGWRGRRFFSVSGDVVRPGVYEVPMGLTLRELIYDKQYCQGMAGGKKFKAFAPSGPSGGFLPAKLTAKAGLPRDHTKNKEWLKLAARRKFDPNAMELDLLDLELELNMFRALSPTSALGAGVCVYAEGRDMLSEAVNSMEFYRNESCGKCVPCRVGSQKLVSLGTNLLARKIDAKQWKDELLPTVRELGKVLELASICGLGRSVPVPLRTVIDYFPDDLARYLAKV
jgi:NADH:ubiquinone oxidoreductase subunit F (NADH-binding)/NADH:ubiquinone oxidoreductase subunit E